MRVDDDDKNKLKKSVTIKRKTGKSSDPSDVLTMGLDGVLRQLSKIFRKVDII